MKHIAQKLSYIINNKLLYRFTMGFISKYIKRGPKRGPKNLHPPLLYPPLLHPPVLALP